MKKANLTIGEVLRSMLRWQQAQSDAGLLTALLQNAAYFVLDLSGVHNEYGMHLYPGISPEGDLEVFSISVCDDRPETPEIGNHITRCMIVPNGSTDIANQIIGDKEAIERIELWRDHYRDWISESVDAHKYIFNAFYIPGSDFPDDSSSQLFFPALSPVIPGKWNIDIVVCIDMKYVFFEDTVRPVPPFKPYGKFSQQSFYLLNICMDLNGDLWTSTASSTD